jgi:uncharacterized membrane protein YkoI
MTSWLKKLIVGAALIAAFALGGAAVANALSSDNGGTSGTAATTDQAAPSGDPAGTDGGRPGEEALTGDTATKVEQAALAKTGGGTVERVETAADGHAAYEAHIVKDDGTRVTVYVNEQFQVVGVEDSPAGHARGDEQPLTGDTAAKVEQAALAETGGGTVERVETDADGHGAYEAHIVKDDGTRVTVYVNEQFAVVDVEEHGAGDGPGAQAPGQSGDQGTDTGGADA